MRQRIPVPHQILNARFFPVFLVFVSISILYVLALIKQDKLDFGNYLIIAILMIFGIFLLYIPRISKIELDNDGFVKYLFTGKRIIKWSEITKVDTLWQFHGHGASLHLCFSLKNQPQYHMPLSFYSRKTMTIFCEAIVSACPGADISPKVMDMASGKFPWYVH